MTTLEIENGVADRPDCLTEPECGERSEESNAAYHADTTAVSHSALECFRKWSPTYFARFVAKTESPPLPSDEMFLGSTFHCCLLEPDQFDSQFVVSPKFDRRTKEGKAAALQFDLAAGNRTVIDAPMMLTVSSMLAAVRQNADVMAFLDAPQRREISLRWVDDETGVLCKCRPDCLTDSGVIVDFKTSSDPTDWLRAANNFGYHRQAAWYREGAFRSLGTLRTLPPFVHVVVGSKPPHAVIVYQLGERSLELGYDQNAEDLRRLAECRRTGDWSDPRETGIQFCELPSYCFPRKEWN